MKNNSMNIFEKKIIWITGGSKGIGFETAKLFSSMGAIVITSSRTNSDKLLELKDIRYIRCDISDSNSVKKSYNEIIKLYGKIDVLINNASVIGIKSIVDLSEDEFDRINNINYKGTFLLCREVLPEMLKENQGMIVNILSIVCFKSFKGSGVYSASKSATASMMKILREEVRESGIDVINIYPGATETSMWDESKKDDRVGKMMEAEDVAFAIVNAVETSFNDRIVVEEIVLRPKLGDL